MRSRFAPIAVLFAALVTSGVHASTVTLSAGNLNLGLSDPPKAPVAPAILRISPGAGLTMSLSTSGYTFVQPLKAPVSIAQPIGQGPKPGQGFIASAALLNRTNEDVVLDLPGSPSGVFIFRVYNSENVLVWDSTATSVLSMMLKSLVPLGWPSPVAPGLVSLSYYECSGAMAAGGGTNVVVVPGLGNFELSFSSKPELASVAQALSGKWVNVGGTLVLEKGNDTALRRTIRVNALSAAPIPAPVTIPHRHARRASVRIPLVVNGTALPCGTYRLEASFGWDSPFTASSLFEITAPATPPAAP